MKAVITDQHWAPLFCQWITEHIGEPCTFDPADTRTIAHVQFNNDGTHEILCVFALNGWTPHTVTGSIASDGTKRWCTRGFLFTVYDYAFRHAGKSRINFVVDADNSLSILLQERIGHSLVGRLVDANGPGRDALLYGLTCNEWKASRWASPKRTSGSLSINNQREQETYAQ